MNNSYEGHICIVFALEHYNPLGLIRSLGENGINPVYIAVKRKCEIASKSKYISKCHYVDTIEEGYKLVVLEYGSFDKDHRPFILFSDDKSVGYFDLHYDEVKDKFIFYNAGQAGMINEFMDKQKILNLAKDCGFNVLESQVVKIGEVPKGIKYPIITKDITPNSGNWKSDVFICQNEDELIEAYKHITSPLIQLQRFVDKQNECALEGFTAKRGKQVFIATEHTWKYLIKGYYSPYQNVRMFNRPEMQANLEKMFEKIGFDGIFEVEFLIDKDGTYYFLEVNFRASAWNYAATTVGMPMPYLWVKSMIDGGIDNSYSKKFEDFSAISEPIDFGKRVDSGAISFAEWLKDFKESKCTYYYNKDDIEPFKILFEKWDDLK